MLMGWETNICLRDRKKDLNTVKIVFNVCLNYVIFIVITLFYTVCSIACQCNYDIITHSCIFIQHFILHSKDIHSFFQM